jgi:hypothetical protein
MDNRETTKREPLLRWRMRRQYRDGLRVEYLQIHSLNISSTVVRSKKTHVNKRLIHTTIRCVNTRAYIRKQ